MKVNRMTYSGDEGRTFQDIDIPFTPTACTYSGGEWLATGVKNSDNFQAIYSVNGIDWFMSQMPQAFNNTIMVSSGKITVELV